MKRLTDCLVLALLAYFVLKEGKPMDPVWKVAINATLGAFVIVLIAALFTGCAPQKQFLDQPDVKVISSNTGHGSGFVMHNGFVITAAHVVNDEGATYTVRSQTGRIYKAELLWVNKAYDIAALRIENPEFVPAKIRCSGPVINEHLTIKGHPFDLEYIESRGMVAGMPRSVSHWKSGFVMDASISPGMSGGGVYANGSVIGVAVGVRIHPVGFAGGPSGFSLAVPSNVVCQLIGR